MTFTRRFFLCSALFVAAWAGLAYLFHFVFSRYYALPEIFMVQQDRFVLIATVPFLLLMTLFRFDGKAARLLPPPAMVLGAILLFVLIGWAGHYAVFGGYSLSRDEQMGEFATFYLREGRLGMPIPAEWRDYVRGINPIFMSVYGGDIAWISNYLPVHAAFRALLSHVADPALTSPLFLGLGYICLWRIALRLFPDRPDAVLVTLLLGFSSTQLLVMSMTAYAMSAHFGLNMLWLALFLRDDWKGHAGAALVALLAVGLHQFHFHPMFAAPFILWLAVRRRWGAVAFYLFAYALIAIIWGKLYPALLADLYSGTKPLQGGKRIDLGFRIYHLITHRLGKDMLPLLNLSRFMAWNNILLLPLALLGAMQFRWRRLLSRDATILMPLAIGCAMGLLVLVYQAHGWGYRYLHGLIGSFCLLGGFGWVRLSGAGGRLSMRPVWLAVGFALLSCAFLTMKAHDFVKPYARAYQRAKSVDADIVLVDTRGGVFIQDIIRVDDGKLSRPILMDLDFVRKDTLEHLCDNYDVRLYDWSDFLPLGVPPARMSHRFSVGREEKRAYLESIGCAQEPLAYTQWGWRQN